MSVKRLAAVLATVMALIVLLLFLRGSDYTAMVVRHDGTRDISADWRFGGSAYALPQTFLAGSDGLVRLHTPLPELEPGDCLLLRTADCGLTVLVDGREVYAYGAEPGQSAAAPACSHIIELPPESAGREVTLLLHASPLTARVNVGPVFLGERSDCIYLLLIKGLPAAALSMASILVALLMIALMTAFARHDVSLSAYMHLQCFVLVGAITLFCGSGVPQLLTPKLYPVWLTENIAMHIVPLPAAAFLYRVYREPREKKLVCGLAVICAASLVACCLMQLTGVANFNYTRPLLFVLLTVCAFCAMYVSLKLFMSLHTVESGIQLVAVFFLVAAFFRYVAIRITQSQRISSVIMPAALFVFSLVFTASALKKLIVDARRSAVLTEQLSQQRIATLLSQIKPHFMYNTLASIQVLIQLDPSKAISMITDFSHYLRANMSGIDTDSLIPFSRELEHIRHYVQIEEVRFAGRVRVEYDAKVTDFRIPPLTIQPLVENAIKHGICKKEEGGVVRVSTYNENHTYYVIVEDDGFGFDVDAVKSSDSVGLANITSRLEQLCEADVTIESKPGFGTRVTVAIPELEGE